MDDATGLPELPEGHYWKVKFVTEPMTYRRIVRIAMKKGRKTIYSDDTYLYIYTDIKTKEDIEPARYGWPGWSNTYDCREANADEYAKIVLALAYRTVEKHKKYLKDVSENAMRKAEAKKLSGDYPPKRLTTHVQ